MSVASAGLPPVYVPYKPDIEQEIATLATLIARTPALHLYNPRWLAVQLLEGDETLSERVGGVEGGAAVLTALDESRTRLYADYGDDIGMALTDQRYSFINQVVGVAVNRPAHSGVTTSDRIDAIVTHRVFGIPIFLVLMWVVFKLTTDVAGPFIDWIDGVIGGPLTRWVVALFGVAGLGDTWFESLVVDGIIAGVGGVLVFVPVLMSLYLALAVLEDSGYMARAAFVMDRVMHVPGLHGKSFLPMVVGFGCTVPAIYAARTLENDKDRILTSLLVPFMSCGARLPVYVLMAAVFFPAISGLVIWGIYLLGIVVALVLGAVLRRTMFREHEQESFIMELPPYRVPTVQGIWFLVWERTSSFLKHAWSVILVTSVVIWVLTAIPAGNGGTFASTDLDQSGFAAVARGVSPIFAPLGFGSWETSGALISGFVAKEVVVSTMAQVYDSDSAAADEATPATPATLVDDLAGIVTSLGSTMLDALKAVPGIVGIDLTGGEGEEAHADDLMVGIRNGFEETSGGHGALAGLAFMVFVLLYTPCMVTVAAEWHELGPKWTWVSIVGQFVLAWLVALAVFQGGLLLGLG